MRHAGYTLIEILVVLFIISIVTSVALLSLGRNENERVETFANELVQTMKAAEEIAMLQPMVLGMSLDQHSLRFTQFTLAGKEGKINWVPLQDKILAKTSIPSGIQAVVKMERQNVPQIVISTNGDVTPFTIYIGKAGEKPRYAVIGEANGEIYSKALS